MSQRTNVRGFSLIELMAVVAIIGIISALAAPNVLVLIRRTRVRSQVSTLIATFNNARSQAMTSGLPTVVCVRGPTYVPVAAVGDDQPLIESYRKANPETVITGNVAGRDVGDRQLDLQRFDTATRFTFAPAMNASSAAQFVYDVQGRLSIFTGTDCTAATNGSRGPPFAIPAAGLPFALTSVADATITQAIMLRSDGSAVLP